MKLTHLIALLLLIMSCELHAQFGETIRTGRPSVSIGTFALGGKTLQFQTGYNYEGKDERQDHSVTNVIRHGIGERWEVSAVVNYLHAVRGSLTSNGFNSLQIGGRYHLTDQNGWIPGSCLQSRVSLPIDNWDYESNGTTLNSILALGWRLTPAVSTIVNLGQGWNMETGNSNFRYTWVANFQLFGAWGAMFEVFGDFDDAMLFDCGLTYLVNPDLQLDCSIGQTESFFGDDLYFDIGFSWRTHWRDPK